MNIHVTSYWYLRHTTPSSYPYTTLIRSEELVKLHVQALTAGAAVPREQGRDVKGGVVAVTPAKAAGQLAGDFQLTSGELTDRKSKRLKSSHLVISYAVLCYIKKIISMFH